MKIEELYTEINSITKSSNKQTLKERMVIDAVERYAREHKMKFDAVTDELDDYVNENDLNEDIDE